MYIVFVALVFILQAGHQANGLKGPCSIDAATTWVKNGRMYLFKGDKYARWDDANDKLGSTRNISAWKGIPNDLDAAVVWGGKNYFFKGCQYWRYYADETSDGPHDIRKGWNVPCNIDAAMGTYVGTTSTSVLFKGDRYWMWFDEEFRGPFSLKDTWKGIEGDLDAGVVWQRNGKSYLLKGKTYWRINGEKVDTGTTLGGWKGLVGGLLTADCLEI